MNDQDAIARFLDGSPHAVVGASRDRSKIGNRVLMCYRQNQRAAYPINPTATEIEGQQAYADLASLPEPVHRISVITPPVVAESIVDQAIEIGIKHIWFQPGAESVAALEKAHAHGINVIAGGACLLVLLNT